MRKKVSIIGGGSAGLFCADRLDINLYDVHIYEKTSKVGRKFLVAGKGGLNLTHHGAIEDFIDNYNPRPFLSHAIRNYDQLSFRKYLKQLGIETYIGSSGKVFPIDGIKPYEVLDTIVKSLKDKGVTIHYNTAWTGWKEDDILINNECIVSDYIVFALGGASWPKTGSVGDWLPYFQIKNIKTKPWQPSNCKLLHQWNEQFIHRYQGKPLKNIRVSIQNKSCLGEALVDKDGIEGGAIYAISGRVREELSHKQEVFLTIDLKPQISREEIAAILNKRKKSITHTLKNELNLSAIKVDLLRFYIDKETFTLAEALSKIIKAFPLSISGLGNIAEAISVVGGISTDELSDNFALRQRPNIYCIGEMVDWDTRTGGYLLQACYSMACATAENINRLST